MNPVPISTYFDILGKAQKIYSRQLDPVCRKWELTRNEVDVLLFLYNNPGFDRATDIVTHRGIAKSHVSMSVASLVDRDLVLRRYSSTDRRNAHLVLTEQGIAIAAEAREAQTAFFRILYDGIPREELDAMEQTMEKVRNNIEKRTNP